MAAFATGLAMKWLLAVAGGLVAATSLAGAADLPAEQLEDFEVARLLPATTRTEKGWTATFASEARYFSWKSDRGFPPGSSPDVRGRGSQLYVPFAAQLVVRPNDDFKFELLGRGGWVHARQSTSGFSGEISTFTDTQVSSTVTYYGFNGIQPFVALSLNAPTGKSSLSPGEVRARMDSDLVDVASFGEGWNIGPTIGFTRPITENLVATVSVGYTRRGTFTREGSPSPSNPAVQAPVKLDPGDVITGTVSIGYQVGQLAGKITGSVSGETDTKVDGARLFRPGMRFLASGTWSYTWPEIWGVTTLTASASHARKNKVLFVDMTTLAPVVYDTEPFNSNSNLYRVGLEHLFPLGQLWLGPTGSFLYRDKNGYDSETLQFVPAKERSSAGVLARYAANERVTFNARAEHVWTHQHDSTGASTSLLLVPPALLPVPGVEAVSSTGWQFAGGANVRF